jgi:GntR family transcriptional regulator, rspAB operon transcriptional repressor
VSRMVAQSRRKARQRPSSDAVSTAANRRPRKTAEGVGSPLPPSAAIDPRRSLSAQVYELAREAIVSLWLKPGQAVSEKEIASQLGVSRTPVREALMRLSDEGLIEVFRQSGTFVSPIKLHDVYEGQLVREALEIAVVRRATRKFDRRFESRFQALLARQRECAKWNDYDGFHALDEEFHRTISECSGTPRVWRIIISAKAQLDRVRRLGIRAPGQFQQILQQHESIVAGMKSGDEALAASALQEHLNAVFTSIRLLLDENSAYFLSEESESSDKTPLPHPVDPPRQDQARTRKRAGSAGLKSTPMIKGA